MSAEAVIATDRASRYLVQLAQHLEHLGDLPHHSNGGRPTVTSMEWTPTEARILFDLGGCRLTADAATLTVRVEASDEARLQALQVLIGHRLEAIGRRDQLQV